MNKVNLISDNSIYLIHNNYQSGFCSLPIDVQSIIVFNLNKRSDINACLRTHRAFEKILEPLWVPFLRRHFPYSFTESQSGISGRSLFKQLSVIDNSIRNGMCLTETKPLVSYFNTRLLEGFFRLNDALKIHNGILFHVGFGDFGRAEITTIDMHYYKNGFDLDKRSGSFRIPRGEIISTCVNKDLFYLGASNGDLLIVDHKKSLLIGTIQTGGQAINCIHAHQDRICASDFLSKNLLIYQLVNGKIPSTSIQMKSEILSMQSYRGDLYCITASGEIIVVDVEKSTVIRTIELLSPISGKSLIKDGLLYSFYEENLKVWDIENKKLIYSFSFQKDVTGMGVHKEYVFVGLRDCSIHVLNRGSGAYLSKIYFNYINDSAIASFNFFGDTLYAYTGQGEIVTIKLDEVFSSSVSKKMGEVLTTLGSFDISLVECSLFEGPNRLFF